MQSCADQVPIASVSPLSQERPEEVCSSSPSSSLAFIKGESCDRGFGVIKTNSSCSEFMDEELEVLGGFENDPGVLVGRVYATVGSSEFLGSLQRLEEAERTLKIAERDYLVNKVSMTMTRSRSKTAQSQLEEARKVREDCVDKPFYLIMRNLEERDSARFKDMSLKFKEKSWYTLLLCFSQFINSYFSHNMRKVRSYSAKVNAESEDNSSSDLARLMQVYCCMIKYRLNPEQYQKRPMGVTISPIAVISNNDCTAIKRPLRVSKEIGLNILNKSKKRHFDET